MVQRILIIEDEAAMRARLTKLATSIDGVEVDCAANEQEADAFIENSRYDVALVDLQLDSKPGRELRGLGYVALLAAKKTQSIIVTGDKSEFLPKVGMAVAGSDVVTKPFSDVVLLGHIERALQWQSGKNESAPGTGLPPELRLDPLNRCCVWRGHTISLTPTELSIVNQIWQANGQRVDLARLQKKLKSGSTHAVTQHITNIRGKFQAVDNEFDKISCHGGAYAWSR